MINLSNNEKFCSKVIHAEDHKFFIYNQTGEKTIIELEQRELAVLTAAYITKNKNMAIEELNQSIIKLTGIIYKTCAINMAQIIFNDFSNHAHFTNSVFYNHGWVNELLLRTTINGEFILP